MRASRGLKWENKMYKLKRSFCNNCPHIKVETTTKYFFLTHHVHNNKCFPGAKDDKQNSNQIDIRFKRTLGRAYAKWPESDYTVVSPSKAGYMFP